MRECKYCNQLKIAETFKGNKCIDCFKSTKAQNSKKYYKNNTNKLLTLNREYNQKNADKLKEYKKEWGLKNKEHIKQKNKAYREANKVLINDKLKNRLKSDPMFALTVSIRKNILKAFRSRSFEKNSSTKDILGCTFEQFRQHIENQFLDWMNWDNRGLYNGTPNYGWDIDHIIPLDTAETIEDIVRLNHYTNLQPLCSYINRDIKKANII